MSSLFPRCFPAAVLTGFGLAFAFVAPAGAAPTASDAAAPKDHAIFVGAGLTIDGDGVSGPIHDVVANTAVVRVGDEDRKISLRTLGSLKIERQAMISTTIVTIDKQTGHRMFSPSVNPALKAAQQQILASAMRDDKIEQANMQIVRADVSGVGGARTSPNDLVDTSAARTAAAANLDNTLTEVSGDFYNSAMQSAGSAGGDAYDMYEVDFEVSAPTVINDAYAAMITTLILPGGRGETGLTVYMKKIGRIDRTPRRLTLSDAGLPQGFDVQKCEIHIYVDGQEIGSNQSQNLVRVSRDEAFQFLLIQHLLAHKADDTAVAMAATLLPEEFRARMAGVGDRLTISVHVSKDGVVEQLTIDPALDAATAAYVDRVIRDTRFYPALVKGQPVAGDATFELREFARSDS